jgi:hypothetical protein
MFYHGWCPPELTFKDGNRLNLRIENLIPYTPLSGGGSPEGEENNLEIKDDLVEIESGFGTGACLTCRHLIQGEAKAHPSVFPTERCRLFFDPLSGKLPLCSHVRGVSGLVAPKIPGMELCGPSGKHWAVAPEIEARAGELCPYDWDEALELAKEGDLEAIELVGRHRMAAFCLSARKEMASPPVAPIPTRPVIGKKAGRGR